MIDVVRFCWQSRKQSTEPYLRTAVDFLLARNVLPRSESPLVAEFPTSLRSRCRAKARHHVSR